MEKLAIESAAKPGCSRRGRKPKNKAARDFILADAEPEFQAHLDKFQAIRREEKVTARLAGDILPIACLVPHEAAAEAMQAARQSRPGYQQGW